MIELDRGAEPSGEPPLPRPRWRRPWSLGIALAVSATALVAAARLADDRHGQLDRLVEVVRVDSAVTDMRIVGTTLLTVSLTGGQRVTAYQLGDGSPRWTVQLPPGGGATASAADAMWLDPAIDVVDGVALVNNGATTVAVDIATGQELWRSPLPRSVNVRASHAIVVSTASDTAGASSRTLRAIEARTGRQLWQYQAPADSWFALPYLALSTAPADRFVVGSPDGRATTVDLSTGEAVASGHVEPTNQSHREGIRDPYYELSGDHLLLNAGDRVSAYALDTLTGEWTVPLTRSFAALTGCGPWLCLSDGHDLHGFTPATGAQAWTVPGYGLGQVMWLRQGVYSSGNGKGTLLDPVTQRVVVRLGSWRVVARSDAGPALLRWANDDVGRTRLGLLTDGAAVAPLGAVPTLGQQPCEMGDGYLACLTVNADLRVWRYQQ